MTSHSAARSAITENLRALMRQLQQWPPFDQMEERHLALMLETATLCFFQADEAIITPQESAPEHFYIVKQGRVRGERVLPDGHHQPTFEIGPGECFPLAALMAERATQTWHLAAEDTFCIKIGKETFIDVFAASAEFREFALRGVSSLLDQVNQRIRRDAGESLNTHSAMEQRLGELALRNPIVCSPDTPLRKAVTLMYENNVGSIVMTDNQRHPVGIFTLRDLRKVIAQNAEQLDDPVANVMTRHPCSLTEHATAFDAALTMAKHHFAHLCVVDPQGCLTGVISERDLFSLQRVDLVHLTRTISSAPNVAALVALRSEISRLVDTMIAHGAQSQQIVHLVTLLNDHTTSRIIELTIKALGDPEVPFSWLVFGSEGRKEQTLLTDQDNGILFFPPRGMSFNEARERLLPLAKQINEQLDRCGFTLCKGNIMASNPKLCLSETEWEQWFNHFIHQATPENLLNSTIFFDLRVIWGDPLPAQRLMERVREKAASNSIFLNQVAGAALQNRPPLNLFRGFVYAKGGERHTIDLKTQGLTPFVDAGRLFALEHNLHQQNTLERFRELAERKLIQAKDAEAWIEAYSLIQLIRMRHHSALHQRDEPPSNRLNPDDLNELDRRILRESFRQAQRLQRILELRYNL
ncbi:MAG: CBS domain-containing protein [Hahellaceae bacterium]|nr:CBS domain-containing protein [Hahellaceae bacterium]